MNPPLEPDPVAHPSSDADELVPVGGGASTAPASETGGRRTGETRWRGLRAASALSVLLIGALTSDLGTAPAPAQRATPTVDRLQIAFWPEYDRADMLVLLRGELAAETALPARLELPLPAGVTTPHAVAWRDALGGLKLAQHTVEERDGNRFVDVTLPSLVFRLEYYAPLEREGALRTHVFDWGGAVAVTSLGYEVQMPVGAADLVVTPPPTRTGTGDDGLSYVWGELGSFALGEGTRIEIAYRRDSSTLSAETLAPPPLPTVPTAETGGVPVTLERPPTPLWPVYVAVALLVGIFIGLALRRPES